MSIQSPESPVNIKDLVLDEPAPQAKEKFDPNNLVTPMDWANIEKRVEMFKTEGIWAETVSSLMAIQILSPSKFKQLNGENLWEMANFKLKENQEGMIRRGIYDPYAAALVLSQSENRDQVNVPSSSVTVLNSALISALRKASRLAGQSVAFTLESLDEYLQKAATVKVFFPTTSIMSEPSFEEWQIFKTVLDRSSYALTHLGLVGTLQALGYKLFAPPEMFKFSPNDQWIQDLEYKANEIRPQLSDARTDEFLHNRAAVKILLADGATLDEKGLKITYYQPTPKVETGLPPEQRRF